MNQLPSSRSRLFDRFESFIEGLLAALQALYARMSFSNLCRGLSRVVGGPVANRQVLVTQRSKLLWRNPDDPVTALLSHGVLVVDGLEHDHYRGVMEPLLSPGNLHNYVPQILRHVDRVTATWADGQTVDMLVESRRMALLIIMEVLFSVDLG
jgi:cytochrome P450